MRHVAPFIHPGPTGLKLKAPMARPGGPLARPQEHVEKRQELDLPEAKIRLHQESEIESWFRQELEIEADRISALPAEHKGLKSPSDEWRRPGTRRVPEPKKPFRGLLACGVR